MVFTEVNRVWAGLVERRSGLLTISRVWKTWGRMSVCDGRDNGCDSGWARRCGFRDSDYLQSGLRAHLTLQRLTSGSHAFRTLIVSLCHHATPICCCGVHSGDLGPVNSLEVSIQACHTLNVNLGSREPVNLRGTLNPNARTKLNTVVHAHGAVFPGISHDAFLLFA